MAFLRNILSLRFNAMRCCSTAANKLIAVHFNEQNKIATINMQRKPVNGLSKQFFLELNDAIVKVEDLKPKGMILTSVLKNVFSAGLDINEMIKPNQEKFKEFWTAFQDAWMKLYGTMVPTVALINGHAPAGGCLLSISCEYRIMLPNFTIGLNEDQLGVVCPQWVIAAMRNTLGPRKAELAITTGDLYPTEEALKIGLIDEIAKDETDAIARAEKYFSKFAKVNMEARGFTKYATRLRDLHELEDDREKDMEDFYSQITKPHIQELMQDYLASLKMRKQNKIQQ